jgi:hypothetical protein
MYRPAMFLLLTCAAAQAEPVVGIVQPPKEPPPEKHPVAPHPEEPTDAELAASPLPGRESGRIDPIDNGDTTARQIGRVALFVPRWTADLAMTPIRSAIELNNRYELGHRDGGATGSARRSLDVEPSLGFQSGNGVTGATAGVRATMHNLAGAHEDASLVAGAGAGAYYRQLYAAQLTSGERLGDVFSLSLDLGYEVRGRDAFYGIGDALGTQTRYGDDRARALLAGDVHVWSDLHVRPSAAFASHQLGAPSDGTPATLDATDIETGYGELAVRWDSRRPVGEWDPVHTPTGGTFAAAYAGREQVVDGAGFWRYGVDVQQLVRLGVGPRVLVLGVHGEGITASPDSVPFVELPALGGPLFLRGFAPDRFRDRLAAAGTLGYRWDLARWIEAQAFVDAGRVYGSLDTLTLSGLRVGYGLGLDLGHGAGRIDIASSLDDGTFVGIWLNPLRDLDTRGRPR